MSNIDENRLILSARSRDRKLPTFAKRPDAEHYDTATTLHSTNDQDASYSDAAHAANPGIPYATNTDLEISGSRKLLYLSCNHANSLLEGRACWYAIE